MNEFSDLHLSLTEMNSCSTKPVIRAKPVTSAKPVASAK